ncbi:unannotated protein [freshwater metagenome]|uniref:Unannotated protein n=1 Tax=freshwater metagenome TaxID=449393 RepID=A0A6J6XJ61_9ZZZZ
MRYTRWNAATEPVTPADPDTAITMETPMALPNVRKVVMVPLAAPKRCGSTPMSDAAVMVDHARPSPSPYSTANGK